MIKDALCSEVVKARLLWLEFEAHQGERFSVDYADRRESSECFGRVLEDLVINWSVTCVDNLNCLIN